MKKTVKLIALILCAVLSVTIFTACDSKPERVQTGDAFTYWVLPMGPSLQTLTSYNDMLMFQELERRTGTKVEFLHPASGSTGSEAFQILMASGDYPDMIEYKWKSYTGGPQRAIDDGVIIALNDYMEEYAPNYYDYMEGDKGKENNYVWKTQSVTEKGNYFGFRSLNVGAYRGFYGIYIRKDKLDEWGLDIPVTIDDWTNVLNTAKENGFKAPFTGTSALFSTSGAELFNGAWGVGKSWYVENGKVKFGPFEKAYKDYIIKMADWTKKGYVDIDYVTNANTNVLGYMTNGMSIASFGYVGSSIGNIIPAMLERDPNYKIAACPYPVLNEGETSHFQTLPGAAIDPTVAITLQCGIDNEDRYKEAISWCDYFCSDEGVVLRTFGVEGETYNVEKSEDGTTHYVYTDKIHNYEAIGGHSLEAAFYHHMLPANSPGVTDIHPDYIKTFYQYEEQQNAIVTWNQNTGEVDQYTFPSVNYTDDEASKKATIESNVKSNLDAAISNIILGKLSVDEYDKAIDEARKAGYDELLKINQAAYDRYISVLG